MSKLKFNVEIDTDNAAFDDAGIASEIARILRELATRLEQGHLDEILLRDFNGNTVGKAHFSEH